MSNDKNNNKLTRNEKNIKKLFLAAKTFYQQSQVLETQSLEEKIQLKEGAHSLSRLSALLLDSKNISQHAKLLEVFLYSRWQTIGGSFLSYTCQPDSIINQLCLAIAKLLHQLNPAKLIYQYLMPTLTNTKEALLIYKNSIDDYTLDEIILSDKQDSIIPANLITNLSPGHLALDELYKPYTKENDKVKKLTLNEQQRLKLHSEASVRFYQLFNAITEIKTNCSSLGGELFKLIRALKRGGARGGHGGTEYVEGLDASLGIIDFMTYWMGLDADVIKKFGHLKSGEKSYSINDIINIFLHTNKDGHKCVEINGLILQAILDKHPELYQIEENVQHYLHYLENEFNELRKKLEQAKGADKQELTFTLLYELKIFDFTILAKGLMPFIEKLTNNGHLSTQETVSVLKAILKTPLCTWKVLHQQGNYQHSVLTWATKENRVDLVQAILNNHYCDSKLLTLEFFEKNTALILAAENGYTAIVKALVAHPHCTLEVLLQKKKNGFSALMFAANFGYTKIVELILRSPHCTQDVFNLQPNERTCLMLALNSRNIKTIKALLKSPHCTQSVLKHQDQYKDTAITLAAHYGNVDLLKEILNHPYCDADILNYKKMDVSALMIAAHCNHTEAVQLLLNDPRVTIKDINAKFIKKLSPQTDPELIQLLHTCKAIDKLAKHNPHVLADLISFAEQQKSYTLQDVKKRVDHCVKAKNNLAFRLFSINSLDQLINNIYSLHREDFISLAKHRSPALYESGRKYSNHQSHLP